MSFGGFYKGDKKKKKKGKMNDATANSTAPVFVMPKMVEKKKKKDE